MTNTTTRLSVGDRVAIRDQYIGTGTAFSFDVYGLVIGDRATITRVYGDDTVEVKWDRESHKDNGINWGEGWFDVVTDEAPQRPLVHFDDEKAGRDRSKAREFARDAVSKVLSDEDNEILAAAGAGESVDAYALNRAVLAAMRSATTRLGQSTARRSMASGFAHLGHIVQAVLENHADNLPGYEPGARSRLLDEAGTALREARVEVERLTSVIDERTSESSEVIADLHRQIAALKDAGAERLPEVVADLTTARTNLSQTIREANEFEATLAYAKSLLSDEDRLKVEGFGLGFTEGARQD